MLSALTQLLLFQLAGEVAARWLSLPVPGPVLGMLFLFLALALRGGPGDELQATSGSLLQHLSLLFVPAGTGVMLHYQRLSDEWLPLAVSLLLSTALTIGLSALVLRLLIRRSAAPKDAS